jgi:hypothetical protein
MTVLDNGNSGGGVCTSMTVSRRVFQFALVLCACTGATFAQYKMEPAGPPPADLPAALRDGLQKDGAKISGPDGALCEVWFRTATPAGSPNNEKDVTLSNLPHGALIGVIKYEAKGQDRRGQNIKPGVYTLRFSYYPVNGAHQGVAPQRDFALLTPVEADTGPTALPAFDALVAMSKKASGTGHPAVLSIWKADTDFKPGFDKEGDDWVLQTKMGDTPLAIILVGVAQS